MAVDTDHPMKSPVHHIVLVDEISKPHEMTFQSHSLPGHLIHLVESGHVEQQAEGRVDVLRKGDLVWYHQTEPIKGEVIAAPWRFITVNFIAPHIPPPSDDCRVVRASPRAIVLMRQLLAQWRNRHSNPLERSLRGMMLLNELLLEFFSKNNASLKTLTKTPLSTDLWWKLEKSIRQNLDEPVKLSQLARESKTSVRTLIRVCHEATGLSPMKRIKILRVNHAKNLLQLSKLSVSEIAYKVGYGRVQELSRDIKKYTRYSPSELRSLSPDFKKAQSIKIR